jgi:hypothetical protein
MATTPGRRWPQQGMVNKVRNPLTWKQTKRDTTTGEFIDQER